MKTAIPLITPNMNRRTTNQPRECYSTDPFRHNSPRISVPKRTEARVTANKRSSFKDLTHAVPQTASDLMAVITRHNNDLFVWFYRENSLNLIDQIRYRNVCKPQWNMRSSPSLVLISFRNGKLVFIGCRRWKSDLYRPSSKWSINGDRLSPATAVWGWCTLWIISDGLTEWIGENLGTEEARRLPQGSFTPERLYDEKCFTHFGRDMSTGSSLLVRGYVTR